MSLYSYIEAQAAKLDAIRRLPHFTLMALGADLYDAAINAVPHESPTIYGRSLLVCHRSFLSAATLIGRGQPEDAAAVTRRAIEAALVCFAFKFDRPSFEKWMDLQKRLDRWVQRGQGVEPGMMRGIGCSLPKNHPRLPLRKELRNWASLLSEKEVHLSPSHFIDDRWKRLDTAAGPRLFLTYFQTDIAQIKREFIALAAVHFKVLEVLDEGLDDALSSNAVWKKVASDFVQRSTELSKEPPSTEARA